MPSSDHTYLFILETWKKYERYNNLLRTKVFEFDMESRQFTHEIVLDKNELLLASKDRYLYILNIGWPGRVQYYARSIYTPDEKIHLAATNITTRKLRRKSYLNIAVYDDYIDVASLISMV